MMIIAMKLISRLLLQMVFMIEKKFRPENSFYQLKNKKINYHLSKRERGTLNSILFALINVLIHFRAEIYASTSIFDFSFFKNEFLGRIKDLQISEIKLVALGPPVYWNPNPDINNSEKFFPAAINDYQIKFIAGKYFWLIILIIINNKIQKVAIFHIFSIIRNSVVFIAV